MCRATNYFGLIRKALVDAGYPQIPVIAISTQGLEDNPGFTATPALLHRTIKALILGDLLMKCLYRVRPYEVTKGAANRLYKQWDVIVREALEHHGFSKTAAKTPWLKRRYLPYPVLAQGDRQVVRRFAVEGRAAQGARRRGRRDPRQVPAGCEQPCRGRHRIAGLRGRGAGHHGVHDHPPVHFRLERALSRHGRQQVVYALMRKGLDRYNAPVREAAIATSHGKFKQDRSDAGTGQEGRRGHVDRCAGRRRLAADRGNPGAHRTGMPERGVRSRSPACRTM